MEPYIFRAHCFHVVDGDTIDVEIDMGFAQKSTHRLRLWGVNTPEKHDEDPAVRNKAYQATEFVASFVENKDIMIQTYKAETFGRYLAKVFVPQGNNEYLCLNEMLVIEGLAKPFMENTNLLV